MKNPFFQRCKDRSLDDYLNDFTVDWNNLSVKSAHKDHSPEGNKETLVEHLKEVFAEVHELTLTGNAIVKERYIILLHSFLSGPTVQCDIITHYTNHRNGIYKEVMDEVNPPFHVPLFRLKSSTVLKVLSAFSVGAGIPTRRLSIAHRSSARCSFHQFAGMMYDKELITKLGGKDVVNFPRNAEGDRTYIDRKDRILHINDIDTNGVKCSLCVRRAFGGSTYFLKSHVAERLKEIKGAEVIKTKASRDFGYQNLCGKCAAENMMMLQYTHERKVTPRSRTFGVEIECNAPLSGQEAVYESEELQKLGISSHRDGSLRTANAVEYASPPLGYLHIKKWVETVCSLSKADVYSRCGLHIWVGVEDYSWADLNKLLVACKKWEEEISELVPVQRVPSGEYIASGAPMRLPRYRMYKTKKDFMSALYGPGIHENGSRELRNLRGRRANEQGQRHFPHGLICRYHWLNVHPYFRCKAIEIRLHHGSVNADEINEWIYFWKAVIENLESFYQSGISGLPKRARVYAAKRSQLFATNGGPVINIEAQAQQSVY